MTMESKNIRKARRIAKLITGYMREELTPEEHDELDEWCGASDKNQDLFTEMTDPERVVEALDLINNSEADYSMYSSYRKILIRILIRTNRWRGIVWCIGITVGIIVADHMHVAWPFIIGAAFGITWSALLYKKSFNNQVL